MIWDVKIVFPLENFAKLGVKNLTLTGTWKFC